MKGHTFQNLLGGLLGGTAGFVVSAWWTPLLPFSVLIGCLLGYWYREVPVIMGEACDAIWDLCLVIRGKEIRGARTIFQKLKSNPLRRAEVVQTVLVLMNMLIFLVGLTLSFVHMAQLSVQAVCGFAILGMAVGIAPPRLFLTFYKPDNQRLYWQEYQKGLWYGFAHDIWLVLKVNALCLFRVILGIVLVTVELFVFFGVFCLFIFTPVFLLRGIGQLISRSQHWLCVCVTMVVTTLFVWRFQPSILSYELLWLLGLLTGICSGVATEAIRLTFARYVVLSRWYQWIVTTSLVKIIDFSNAVFEKTMKFVTEVNYPHPI